MNKQKEPHGIEWTRIAGRPGYTWNPTTGCMHGCTWKMPDGSVTECYAKTVYEKFKHGASFEHHAFHVDRLDEPLKLKTPSGIFVGSMADLFGHWVPNDEIIQVIDTMQVADWHIFQTLSKYPIRLKEFVYPDNVWVGVSLPAGHQMPENGAKRALSAYLRHIEEVIASVVFMSIEPLWFDVAPVFEQWLQDHGSLPFDWAIVGAASKGRTVYQPKAQWVADLLSVLDDQGIPVFFKGNLEWYKWRSEFPVAGEAWGGLPPEPGVNGQANATHEEVVQLKLF